MILRRLPNEIVSEVLGFLSRIELVKYCLVHRQLSVLSTRKLYENGDLFIKTLIMKTNYVEMVRKLEFDMEYDLEPTNVSLGENNGEVGREQDLLSLLVSLCPNVIKIDFTDDFISIQSGQYILSTMKRNKWNIEY